MNTAVNVANCEKVLHDLTMYILIQSGFGIRDGILYDPHTNEFIQYNNKMICYPGDDNYVDVITFNVAKSSKIMDTLFAKYAANMARYEGVVIEKWYITRTPAGSSVSVSFNDNGESVRFETRPYKIDSLAYAEAFARINGIEEFNDLNAMNNSLEMM